MKTSLILKSALVAIGSLASFGFSGCVSLDSPSTVEKFRLVHDKDGNPGLEPTGKYYSAKEAIARRYRYDRRSKVWRSKEDVAEEREVREWKKKLRKSGWYIE